MHTVIIADDHPFFLKGLFKELSANGFSVVGQATNGILALELLIQLEPTIAIIDIEMPILNGLEVIKMAKEKGVKTKFIIQSFHKEESVLMRALSLKIDGYLLKEDDFSEMKKCILSVLRDEQYFSPALNDGFLSRSHQNLFGLNLLTNSEITILKYISQRHSTKYIADHFNVSPRTIEKHRSNILKKINVEGTISSLSNWAFDNKDLIMDL